MHVSGVAVQCRPEESAEVAQRVGALPGAEVHHLLLNEGKLTVVIESEDLSGQLAQFRAIQALPGVLVAKVAYHAFEGDPKMQSSLEDGSLELLNSP